MSSNRRVIVACCVLHNIALDRNQNLDDDELADLPLDDDDGYDPLPVVRNEPLTETLIRREGFAKRNRITETHF